MKLRLILGDQLNKEISSFDSCDKNKDVIMLCEVMEEAQYVKHHKKKIAFIFSAMRHFASELEQSGFNVRYVKLTDPHNTGSFTNEVKRAIKLLNPDALIVTFPGEYRVLEMMKSWEKSLSIPVEIRSDNRFLCEVDEFANWAKDKKTLRMEYFYREMRKKYDILMKDSKPIGGQWNYDADNRKKIPDDLKIPQTYHTPVDDITQSVINLVGKKFGDHFGDIEPFEFAVTRRQALNALKKFIAERLPYFGDYQDAMVEGQAFLFHSHISFYLNIGLLLPMECIEAAQTAYLNKKAPLNAVEGFIRQILGWREYVRGIYWMSMPGYEKKNYLNAKNKLPKFFWTGDTSLNCLKQCIGETKQNAYAHHIQRLMVLGNFLLLAGVSPEAVNEWYLIVYADAYEWVEMPNVTGMILYADGGLLASKPYIASGAYINKMSDYCKNCQYKVNVKNGEDACPYNYLYWNFLITHKEKLKNNQRLALPYKTLGKMAPDKIKLIKEDTARFLASYDQSKTKEC